MVRRWLAAMLAMLVCAGAARAEISLHAGVFEGSRQLAYDEAGRPRGLIGELGAAALAEAGYRVRIVGLPAARIAHELETGALDLAFAVPTTADRGWRVRFSRPIVTAYDVLVVARARPWTFNRWRDLAGRRIGGLIGLHYPALETAGALIDPEANLALGLAKLNAGRLDAVILDSIDGLAQLNTLGYATEMQPLDLAVTASPLGLALSPRRFGTEDVARLDEALTALLNGPEGAALMVRYGGSGLYRGYRLPGDERLSAVGR
jgi:ABC-type amino acid transport substrate-binding protein